MEDLLKLKGKNIVVMGVANERSLAWGSLNRFIQQVQMSFIHIDWNDLSEN